jgi:hypothetical protein
MAKGMIKSSIKSTNYVDYKFQPAARQEIFLPNATVVHAANATSVFFRTFERDLFGAGSEEVKAGGCFASTPI